MSSNESLKFKTNTENNQLTWTYVWIEEHKQKQAKHGKIWNFQLKIETCTRIKQTRHDLLKILAFTIQFLFSQILVFFQIFSNVRTTDKLKEKIQPKENE